MIKMSVLGNLGKDCVCKVPDGQTNVAISFSVCHTEKAQDGAERAVWVNCTYWRDPQKTAIANFLKKGTKVYVEGMPSARHYVGKDGQTYSTLELKVYSIELAAGGQAADSQAQQQQQPYAPQAPAQAQWAAPAQAQQPGYSQPPGMPAHPQQPPAAPYAPPPSQPPPSMPPPAYSGPPQPSAPAAPAYGHQAQPPAQIPYAETQHAPDDLPF